MKLVQINLHVWLFLFGWLWLPLNGFFVRLVVMLLARLFARFFEDLRSNLINRLVMISQQLGKPRNFSFRLLQLGNNFLVLSERDDLELLCRLRVCIDVSISALADALFVSSAVVLNVRD